MDGKNRVSEVRRFQANAIHFGGKLNNQSWSKWPEHKMKVNLCLKTQISIFVLECRIESQIDY